MVFVKMEAVEMGVDTNSAEDQSSFGIKKIVDCKIGEVKASFSHVFFLAGKG